jgi:DNA-binding PadR family transcriptional regulator
MKGLQGLGRFSEPALQVLVCLAGGPKHGWAIANEIEARTGRRPQPATLYGAIGRIEERGWIRALSSDGRRRPFAITDEGRDVLAGSLEELTELVRAGRRALKLGLA